MKSRIAGLLLLSLTIAAVGCDADESAADGSADSEMTDGPVATARYELTTEVDLTEVPDWTGAVDEKLAPLRRLKDNPARTLLDELAARNAPLVNALKAQIPDALEAKFAGWFNADALGGQVDGQDAGDALSDVSSKVSSMLGKFEVLSTLAMAPGTASGAPAAKHTITGCAFKAGAERVVVDAPDLIGAIKPAEKIPVKTKGGDLELGGHSLSLPVGNFSARGLDLLSTDAILKTGLKFALGRIIKCGEIAKSVSNKCVVGICVGHEDEIEELCDKGLDAVVDVTVSGMKKLNLDPLSFVGGDLKLPGGLGGDGALSGVWKSAVDLGKGERLITSKFKGRKL